MMHFRAFARFLWTVPLAGAACGSDNATGAGAVDSLSFIVGDVTVAATSSSATLASGTLTVQAQGTISGIARTLTISVQASAPGTFTVGAAGGASVVYSELAAGTSVAKQWEARNGSGSGTLTLSQLSATRVVGSFVATLPPVTASGATASKSLSNGILDVKLTGY
jgi:hypothetical protein